VALFLAIGVLSYALIQHSEKYPRRGWFFETMLLESSFIFQESVASGLGPKEALMDPGILLTCIAVIPICALLTWFGWRKKIAAAKAIEATSKNELHEESV
jgi:hypothetical protein